MKRTSISLRLLLIVLAAFSPAAWSATDSLTFFNNWFVTGDYAVGGVGLRGTGVGGWATGTINMTGVPSGAQPIAAFLYWSTAEATSTPGASIGYFNTQKIQGAALGNAASPNPGCAASGGATSGYGFVYRADVLRYLPVDANNIPQASGSQTVKLPDAGTGSGILTNGASLVVIYKIVIPGLPNAVPLRAVVIYNGAYTMDKHSPGLTQNVAGFYQATDDNGAKMTSIVANGQTGYSSPLSVNGDTIATHPFQGAQGVRWDNPTFQLDLNAGASSFSTMATAGNNQTCLTFAAIVASTIVRDSDHDGLLDIWENQGLHRNTQVFPATFGTCAQYPSEPCVNLPKMGASSNRRDIFIQIDWMNGTGDGTGGIDGRGTHDHMPQLAALSTAATVFANKGINLHFDVGPNYQGNQAACGNAPCPFIVPAAYASGGSDMPENSLVCNSNVQKTTHPCNYSPPTVPYPVLSFEYGFASIKDGNSLLGIPAHFAQNRKDIFHYALFAHALAGPFNASGQPIDPFSSQPLPAPATPYSYSGIAHRPGGGFMVTLGLWRSDIPAYDQVGSAQEQAGTLMHELGHNLGLGHAGLATKPNCMPNYPSVMNYLYQTRGLTDASGAEQVDYSNGVLLPLSEDLLTTSIPMGLFPGLQKYRVRYYGPLAPNQPPAQAAQLHCDGTPITGGQAEVRLEGPAVSTPDWSNGTVPLGKISPPLDVNYDGTTGQLFLDQPDWLTINLQQIGTGYSFGGLSVGAFATDGGAYATDGGAFATDAGALATDGGAFATDGGAFATDGGAFATDGGAFATDGGAFATDGGAFATDAGEIDENTVLLSSVDPPSVLTAANPNGTGITLTWTPPSVGHVVNYNVYRCAVISPATSCTPPATPFASAPGGTPAPSFNDAVNDTVDSGKGGSATCSTKTCYNTIYYYFVTAVVSAANKTQESGDSNTVNTEVPHLFVIANAAGSVVYGTANPTPTFTIYGDVAGSLSGVQCAYSTVPPRNVGTYTIACSGPATVSANNGVTYNATYLGNTSGTLTITQRPLTVTFSASSKVYDGTTSSPAAPAITTGSLAYSDSLGFIETYDNRNVGAAHVMTPSGIVNDLNGGLNYNVTLVPVNGGIITVRPITVTAMATTKTYDGGITSLAVPTITTGSLGAGDSVTWMESYDNKNVGTTHVMTPAGTVSDGNGGNNYSVLFVPGNGTITPAPASVTPNASGKVYGTSDPTLTGTLSGFLAADGVTATYTRVAGENVGTYTISATLSPIAALGNYSIRYNTALFTITPAPQSIAFGPLSGQSFGTPDFNVSASASSGLPVAFTATGNCTVTPAGLVHLVTTGACSITASQTGSLDYMAAPPVSQSFTITAIDFTKLSSIGSPAGVVPTATPTTLTMSTATTGTTSAAWLPAMQPVASGFTTQFTFQISSTGGQPADGFAFVIQNSPAGITTLGTTGQGGYIGYQGLTNSLAIEFDTFQNGWDPNANHVAIQSNFIGANSSDHSSSAKIAINSGIVTNLSDGNPHIVIITYASGTLSVTLDGTQVLSAAVNLTSLGLDANGNGFVGFTAATGADSEQTLISNWSFTAN